jgi:16S rRNA (cytosine967-C5)-methyltransferase
MSHHGRTNLKYNVRALAAQALAPVLTGRESLSDTLPPAINQAAAPDRGLVQALAFTACRHAWHYRAVLRPLLQKAPPPPVEALLLIGLAQLRELRIPDHAALSETVDAARVLRQERATGLINAVLRRYLRERDTLELQAAFAAHAHPDWLKIMLESDWGQQQALEIMSAGNQEGPLTLRVNLRAISRADYLEKLQTQGIGGSPCRYSDTGIVSEFTGDVRSLPGFADGEVSIQDEAAQLCTGLLACQPGMRVLDACAAPGGKTASILERTEGLALLALDISPDRCTRIEENLQRLRLPGATIVAADAGSPDTWWDGKPFDRILLDAPCTATGVIRRHPDIKLLRRQSDVLQTAKQQARLLQALWPLLAPGGVLLYATCSVLKAENEAQVAAFLAQMPDAGEWKIEAEWGEARPQGRQLFPEPSDGFYYARLQKHSV